MKQVAELAGVAPSTVSRVLTGAATSVSISDETRRRVLASAEELGFRPSRLARGLRGSRTALLGLLVRDLRYPLHQSLVDAIVREAHDRGYHVVIGSTDGLDADQHELERILETRMVDGVVVVGGLDDLPGLVDELYRERIPVVGLGLGSRDGHIPIVRSDNEAGARLAFEHLAELGHRRLAVVVAGVHPEIVDRRDVFLAAAAAAGITVPPAHVIDVANRTDAAETAVAPLLASSARPTAVFCTTDMVARGVLRAAQRAGIGVPDGLSVVGYDDQEWAADWWPSLTSVRQDAWGLGSTAVRLVLEAIDDPSATVPFRDWLPVRLEVRASTGPARPDPVGGTERGD
ncbi:MAG: LacI family DNA-binding transcriptional regulator [Chloroflexi bacterium]|nr:LacI family DNA-binding transcriptional regulator [Chloroflexota bacterium]